MLTLAGTIILILGIASALRTGNSSDAGLPAGALATAFVGGILFSIGGLMLLVAVVRPLFEKRPIDEQADRLRRP